VYALLVSRGDAAEEGPMLTEQIAELADTVQEARHELTAVDLARRQGQPGTEQTVAEEEGALELDLAKQDLAALEEAQRLLQTVAANLDEPDKERLALAARLLYDVDPGRPDALAGETVRLRELRLRMPGAVN